MAKMTPLKKRPTMPVLNRLVTASDVLRWFDEALGGDNPKPSLDQCRQLACDVQRILNRYENAERQRRGPTARDRLQLKDVDPTEELNRRVKKVESAAQLLGAATKELEDFVGAHEWSDGDRSTDLEDIRRIISTLSTVVARASRAKSGRGRPREAWHVAGRQIAQLVRSVLEAAGYTRRLNMIDQESFTARVGAAAISWLFGIMIESSGFATAMRPRDRRKGGKRTSFDHMCPDGARI
jgi:hypothetical protein